MNRSTRYPGAMHHSALRHRALRLALASVLTLVLAVLPALGATHSVQTYTDGAAIPILSLIKPKPAGHQLAAVHRDALASSGRFIQSGSIGLGHDPDLGNIVWTANGNAHSVSIVVLDDIGTTPTFDTFAFSTGAGSEPTNIAVAPDGLRAWVTLRGLGLVLPIFIDKVRGVVRFGRSIPVGAEPVGIILDSLQRNLYVANSTEGTVSVIDLTTGQVAARVFLGDGSWPFAIAARTGLTGPTGTGGEKIYVTSYFSKAAKFNNGGETDDSRTGRVFVIKDRKLASTVSLKPFPCFTFPAGSTTKIKGFPNQLNSIAIKGKFAYVVSIGASPQRPLNFTANTQAFVQVFDTDTDTEVDAGALNMNASVDTESPKGVFLNTPWGIAFSQSKDEAVVLSAASNVAVKLEVDPTTGVPVITGTAFGGSSAGIHRIVVGKNPRGVVLSPDGSLAYVHNYISRDLTVIGLGTDRTITTIQLSPKPTSTRDAALLHGEELYNTSLGTSTVDPAALNPGHRMSTNGWGSCFSCHPFGWTDTVVWNFNDGPRKTLPTIGRALASPRDTTDVRMLNWSAVRDELEDFEQNIRKVSSKFDATNQADDGKTGLMPGVSGSPTSSLGAQDIFDIITGAGKPAKPNKGRSKDWDDLAAYMRSVRSPLSPIRSTDSRVSQGAVLFDQAGCNECHGGPKWTSSRRPYDPAKLTQTDADRIKANGLQIVEVLRKVDTFITTEESAIVTNGVAGVAKGAAGFNPPSLVGFWAFAPYFHNGKALTISDVLKTPLITQPHMLASEDASKRANAARIMGNTIAMANLELFLRSIDDRSGIRVLPARPKAVQTAVSTVAAIGARQSAQIRVDAPVTTGVPGDAGLDAGGRARFKPSGVADRKYRPISIGDGFQSVKGKDDLGSDGKSGSTTGGLRGIVFAKASGAFTPTGDGKTTVTLVGTESKATFQARDVALAKDGGGTEYNFALGEVPPGAYQVTVKRPGFGARTSSLPVVLERGQVVDLDVFLEPAP